MHDDARPILDLTAVRQHVARDGRISPDFAPSQNLPKVRVGRWGRLVSVNPDPNCEPLEHYVGDLLSHFSVLPYEKRYKEAHVAEDRKDKSDSSPEFRLGAFCNIRHQRGNGTPEPTIWPVSGFHR